MNELGLLYVMDVELSHIEASRLSVLNFLLIRSKPGMEGAVARDGGLFIICSLSLHIS